jgi:hypothetical protein
MQFNGILIGSDDPARLIAYYTKVLGEPGYADEAIRPGCSAQGRSRSGPTARSMAPTRSQVG